MTNKHDERVEEIVEELKNEWLESSGVSIIEFIELFVTQTLQTERTKRDEMVGVVLRDLKTRMGHPDYHQCPVCEETEHHLQSLTHYQ